MNTNQFFYISNGNQIGPVPMEELAGKITPDTDVWCDGMPNWAKAGTVPELAAILGMAAPPPPMGVPEMQQEPQYGDANPYASGNSQNYGGDTQSYGDNTQSYGGNSQNYGGNTQSYGGNQQPFGDTQSSLGNNQQPAGEKPQNYLVLSIVLTVLGACSCLPLITGIISIVFAAKVDSEWNIGHADEAKKASDKAKLFAIITAVLLVLSWIISLFSGVMSSALREMQYQ
ncbi:MAG: CD225/dispanin family protein [Bacteroidales bacterium]|nr:CD225/dispanin family protein [Bacteroidales bacterium]